LNLTGPLHREIRRSAKTLRRRADKIEIQRMVCLNVKWGALEVATRSRIVKILAGKACAAAIRISRNAASDPKNAKKKTPAFSSHYVCSSGVKSGHDYQVNLCDYRTSTGYIR